MSDIKFTNSDLMNGSNEAALEIKTLTGCRPVGGEDFLRRLGQMTLDGNINLFIPWAATSSGRTELIGTERNTLKWLFGYDGLRTRLQKFGDVNCLVMLADIYAERNGFDMYNAESYWMNVREYAEDLAPVEVTRTSAFDGQAMRTAVARNSYAFESLSEQQQTKILSSAARYSGLSEPQAVYESAAEYCMLRAGEAEYVSSELGTLWVSLNWPERDIMCRETPRMYVPEALRAPWLKDTV